MSISADDNVAGGRSRAPDRPRPAAWTRVMPADDLWEGDLVGAEVGRTKVVLVNVDGEIRAYLDRCPHQEWPLSEGDLDGCRLTCINHLWEFNAVSGKGINPSDAALTALPCQVEDGDIYVAAS